MTTVNFQNHLLIASPSMEDNLFVGSVILICEHNSKGALGVIINKPTDILMTEIYRQLSFLETDKNHDTSLANEDAIKINRHKFAHFGGPLNSERGLVLHENHGKWQQSININQHINLTSSQDIMKALANGEGPKRNVFVLGYASWEPGQLENELLDNSWITIALQPQESESYYQLDTGFNNKFSPIHDLLFSTPADLQWYKAIELLGIDPEKLSDQVGHA